ncbi:ABC transporter permease [Mesorhizobium sp. M2A.F.Ca.ET.039.01.1.1]|uniref:ABC transporter permease n=1 Tax=Mesorhizobium sp. M2A.F.Ca.ET.039.01.1.1 TaxID=2496746 RepID=UPI000FCBE035|nr:ABC transporter permease [Mesorhizobium sp. M2A.F.Ca.ET.039.01.1.1]RWX70670.1 ABC transporter permease subunit [Mesorhizobium sp. M2A.F.Ca.ET.039.01.1.1]TIV39024.1 MAG: ABC transporter permease subunit [Mesorhizobium sp.]TIV47153.1 MAG: ABC transporter permease subunit [Mesorhizobium sp.]
MRRGMSWFNVTSVSFGLAFLYLPMLVLVIYSFNASKLVTVWAGFSTKWYGSLFHNAKFLDAALISLKVALVSAMLATALGTMTAFVLVRAGRFPGRTVFAMLVFAPLVMPEVIIGLSTLLLFIAVGLDRGMWTIILAQSTVQISFVTVIVAARLASHDRSMDEAAQDLGCTQFTAFWLVTLPLIAPAVVSGWFLAFSLSLDNLVVASFTSGPESTTLPVRLFSMVRTGVSPEINALSTIVIGIVATGVIAAALVERRARRKTTD